MASVESVVHHLKMSTDRNILVHNNLDVLRKVHQRITISTNVAMKLYDISSGVFEVMYYADNNNVIQLHYNRGIQVP